MDLDARRMDIVCLVNKRKSLIAQIRQKRVQPKSAVSRDFVSTMEKGDSSIAKVQPNSVRLKNHASTSALVEYIASGRTINEVIFRTMIIVAQLSRFFLTRDHHRNDLPFRAKSYHASDYGLEQAKITTIPHNLLSRLIRTLIFSEVLRFNSKLLKFNVIV